MKKMQPVGKLAAAALLALLVPQATMAADMSAFLENLDLGKSGVFSDISTVRAPKAPWSPSHTPARPPQPKPAPNPGGGSSAGSVSLNGTTLPSFIFTGRGGDVSAQVAAAIDASRISVNVALYTLTLPNVADSLVRAKQRGVAVQVVYDFGHSSSAGGASVGSQPSAGASEKIGQLLSAGIPVRVLRGSGPYGIMHNKFAVIDGQLVETGSFNWTTAADTKNHENALFRTDGNLIADYQAYFDWMWRQAGQAGGGSAPGPTGTPPSCADGPSALGRTWPECSFSPGGPTEALIAQAIGLAKTRVHIAMFSFTSPSIVQAIIAANNRGVDVMLVFDRLQAKTEAGLKPLQDAGVPYRLNSGLGGSGGVLHDKFGLFDDLLETGSFNYTTNASQNNFENAFFSSASSDLDGYESEFQAIYAEGSNS